MLPLSPRCDCRGCSMHGCPGLLFLLLEVARGRSASLGTVGLLPILEFATSVLPLEHTDEQLLAPRLPLLCFPREAVLSCVHEGRRAGGLLAVMMSRRSRHSAFSGSGISSVQATRSRKFFESFRIGCSGFLAGLAFKLPELMRASLICGSRPCLRIKLDSCNVPKSLAGGFLRGVKIDVVVPVLLFCS